MSPGSVLIVDDNTDLAENLGEVLTEEGFSCSIADCGLEAIDRLGKNNFDVIITDLRMARGDGLSVVAAARLHSPRSRIVLMTAYAQEPQLDAARQAGVSEVVGKPLDTSALLELVRRFTPSAPA